MNLLHIDLGGHSVPVTVRSSARARRMTLRLDPAKGAVLTLPLRVSLATAESFLLQHRTWLAERSARRPERVPFAAGEIIPLRGLSHEIRHCPEARRGVWIEDQAILVSGAEEYVARRVGDFLKEEARRILCPRVRELAKRVGRTPGRITVKDTRTRWGSCSSRGDLAFSWRLVLAPEAVLDYVVAHEVAHLVEMNHAPAFWRVVATLVEDADTSRAWLKRHGAGLHRYR